MQWKNAGELCATPDSIYALYTRVKLNASFAVTVAGIEDDIGVVWSIDPYGNTSPYAPITVRTPQYPGSTPMIAAGAFSANAILYPAASGKVDDDSTTGGRPLGIALQAASGSGSIVEVMRFNLDKPKFSITREVLAASVDNYVWIADRPCTLIKASAICDVVGGSSAAVAIRKITAAGTARAGASAGSTCIEMLTAGIDLTTTAGTVAAGTLSAVAGALNMAIGDKLAFDFSGTLTSLVGAVSMDFQTL